MSEIEWKAWRWDILADDPTWLLIDMGSGYHARAERLEKRLINFVQMLSHRYRDNETEEKNSYSINFANASDSDLLLGGYGLAGTE